MNQSGGKPKFSRALFFKWQWRFKNGRKSVEDDDRCGKEISILPTFTTKVKEMLDADRRATVMGISADLGISASTVYNILKDLHMCKVSARWLPRLLKLVEKGKVCLTSIN